MNKDSLEQAPAWFPETLAAPERVPLWTTSGKYPVRRIWPFCKRGPSIPYGKLWRVVLRSKEEAEAISCTPRRSGWVWNGEPAEVESLSEAMSDARVNGMLGVQLIGFENGKWVMLKAWRADEPLPNDEAGVN